VVWESSEKRSVTDGIEKRRQRIIHGKLERWEVQEIATALRASEKTIDRSWHIYRKHGWAGLHVKSHKPHAIHRTSQSTVDLILQLRRTRNWGPCRIEGYLRKYDGQSRVSHTTSLRSSSKLD
jgi:transposase